MENVTVTVTLLVMLHYHGGRYLPKLLFHDVRMVQHTQGIPFRCVCDPMGVETGGHGPN